MVTGSSERPGGAAKSIAVRLSGFLRMWWCVHGGQRLEIGRHRRTIVVAQLRRVPDYASHRTPDRIAVRQMAGVEEIGDVLLRPGLQTFLGDVRHPSFPFRVRSAGNSLRRNDTTENIARAAWDREKTACRRGRAISSRR